MVIVLISGCKKQEVEDPAMGFYLLEDYETSGKMLPFWQYDEGYPSQQIINSTVVTSSVPVIEFTDIISYDSAKHLFKLTDSAFVKVSRLPKSLSDGLSFALKVDNQIIYTGYFFSFFSSFSCDWNCAVLRIGRTNYEGMEIILSYPFSGFFSKEDFPHIQDFNTINDPRLIEFFEKNTKLVKYN